MLNKKLMLGLVGASIFTTSGFATQYLQTDDYFGGKSKSSIVNSCSAGNKGDYRTYCYEIAGADTSALEARIQQLENLLTTGSTDTVKTEQWLKVDIADRDHHKVELVDTCTERYYILPNGTRGIKLIFCYKLNPSVTINIGGGDTSDLESKIETRNNKWNIHNR